MSGSQHVPSWRLALTGSWLVAAVTAALARPDAFTDLVPVELVPAEHRPAPATLVVLARTGVGDDAWAHVVDTLGPQLPGHRPLAPPPVEARAWLDAHLLWWADDAGLARRFEPDALRAAVAGVRARMASPLFAIDGDEVRRDPLGLRAPDGVDATTTASGDRLSADGGALLVHLQTARSTQEVASLAAQLIAQQIGDANAIEVKAWSLPESPRTIDARPWIFTFLAFLSLILALGLRRLRHVLALVIVLGACVPLVWFIGPHALVLLGGAAALALPHARKTAPTPWLLLAVAPLPLALLPYPAWQRLALTWPLAVLILAVGVRLVLPAVLDLVRARPPTTTPPTRPLPPTAALITCTVIAAAAAWPISQALVAPVGAPDQAPVLGASGLTWPNDQATLLSRGDTPAAALAAAARDARAVAQAVPGARIDGPGAFVLDDETLAARAATLAAIDLPGRVEFLRATLAEHGLRPDAFGEFFRALDPHRQPGAEAALHGPLGPWLTSTLLADDVGFTATTRVDLPAELPEVLPAQLRGPAVFAHRERLAFSGHLALVLAAGAWLSAFVTWLAARRLAPALAAAAVGLVAQVGALAVVALVDGEISPSLFPVLLVLGAATAHATTVACAPRDDFAAPTLAPACLAAPGLVLMISGEPSWHAPGLALALGAALGGLLASHAGPGLLALLRRPEVRP